MNELKVGLVFWKRGHVSVPDPHQIKIRAAYIRHEVRALVDDHFVFRRQHPKWRASYLYEIEPIFVVDRRLDESIHERAIAVRPSRSQRGLASQQGIQGRNCTMNEEEIQKIKNDIAGMLGAAIAAVRGAKTEAAIYEVLEILRQHAFTTAELTDVQRRMEHACRRIEHLKRPSYSALPAAGQAFRSARELVKGAK